MEDRNNVDNRFVEGWWLSQLFIYDKHSEYVTHAIKLLSRRGTMYSITCETHSIISS